MSLRRKPGGGRRAVALGSAAAVVAGSMFGGMAYADDGGGGDPGQPVLKSISHDAQDPTVPGYVDENEHAFTSYMKFYVPSQAANGSVLDGSTAEGTSDYYDVDGNLLESRELAKPLVDVFIKGPVETVEGLGFVGHGKRDAYAAVSLDDGMTWKKTNLSDSASETSSTVVRTDVPLFADTDGVYPGDVVNIFHAVAGTNVLVAWPSRYCSSGQPNYSLDGSAEGQAKRAAIAAYLGIDLSNPSPDDLYLLDMYRVAGNQGSVDYTEDKWEQNWPVGEVPFNCLWTARGELVQGDDPRTADATEASYMRWFNTERLTSGRRDVARIEVAGVAGAGFVITWQEDPEGLRPGQGEGPGEGWSGAIANSQTDVWYSYIDAEDFDVVQDPADPTGATPMTFADYTALAVDTTVTQKPKPFVPMAMPMRITDNAKCNVTNPAPYCYGDAIEGSVPVPTDDEGIELDPREFGLRDMCFDTVTIPTGHNDTPTEVCVTEDGLPLLGNTAATRPRVNLFGYDSTGKVKGAVIDSAFVVVQSEEDKGLGRASYLKDPVTGLPTETLCPADADEKDCVPFDDGKNQWYFSFNMSLTDKGMVTNKKDGLLTNLSFHGNLLNQPEVNWTTGEFFDPKSTEDMFGWPEYNYDLYATEIARRGSLLAQDIAKVHPMTSKAKSGLLALPTWKQGQMNQGGPADVMSRRIVMPKNWKIDQGNPYAFRNMQCTTWAYKDGSNPNYPEGVCLDPAVNLSATVPDTAVDTATDAATALPVLTEGGTFLASDTNPILQGLFQGEGDTTKVLTWHQCPAVFTNVSGVETVTCADDDRPGGSTLADQSWYNPYDVAKGHRGFLDGDFVMMLYAWSPNWRLNAKGSDRYELYIRRSFTGGQSWTTLPSKYTDTTGSTFTGDGTTTCETFRSATTGQGAVDEPRTCNEYTAGAPEQARNVTQHKSMRITTLDPRFAMTGGPYGYGITADPFGYGIPNYTSGTGDSEDVRDPSRFFIVYETGDNTTAAEGEPEPLDLFYSRGVNFGDDYEVWAETEDGDVSACYPSNPHEDTDVPEELIGSGFCNEFDQMEQGTPDLEASEASLAANPGGEFLYGAWAELAHEDGEVVGSDAMARRVWWIDGYVSTTYGWIFGQGTGDGTPATP